MTWFLPYIVGVVAGFSTYAIANLSIGFGYLYGLAFGFCAWFVFREDA